MPSVAKGTGTRYEVRAARTASCIDPSPLDHDLRQHLRQELETVLDRTGIPLLLISHDPQDVAMFGQQVARVVDGRIVGD